MHDDSNWKYGYPFVAIIGPTAVGKTDLVLNISSELGAEVVSVDSMQVYRHMDIGTAKPTKQEQEKVRHHLVDIVDPDEEYNVQRFVEDAECACRDIIAKGRVPILSGGTGLYLKGFEYGLFDLSEKQSIDGGLQSDRDLLRAELSGQMETEKGREQMHLYLADIDPASAARIHKNDRSRMIRALEIYKLTGITWSEHLKSQQGEHSGQGRLNILKIGLTSERKILYERINKRTELMMESGLVEEVKGLIEMGYSSSLKSMQSIGYKHINEYLAGNWGRDQTIQNLARDTRRYAKRQFTWFHRDPGIKWFETDQENEIKKTIKQYLKI